MTPNKPWYLSKTLWLHAIGIAILVGNQILPLTTNPTIVADIGVALNALGFANRFLTNTPIGGSN